MKINLTDLITNAIEEIILEEDIIIPSKLLSTSNIKRLENVKFKGKILKDFDNNLLLEGTILGTMILPDDITLEEVNYEFESEISEYLDDVTKVINNNIDILDFLWQCILVEIPLKVHNSKNNNIRLHGEGWELITEEEAENKKNCPFSDLANILNKEGRE